MEEDIRSDSVTVGATAVRICTEREVKPRSEIILTNSSAGGQSITLTFGREASTGAGVVLLPFAVYWATATYGYSPTQGSVWAVASGAGAVLSVMER